MLTIITLRQKVLNSLLVLGSVLAGAIAIAPDATPVLSWLAASAPGGKKTAVVASFLLALIARLPTIERTVSDWIAKLKPPASVASIKAEEKVVKDDAKAKDKE